MQIEVGNTYSFYNRDGVVLAIGKVLGTVESADNKYYKVQQGNYVTTVGVETIASFAKLN